MFKKSHIAMLVAGGLFAGQAGAVSSLDSPDVAWIDDLSSAEQITVFNPDGSSYSLISTGIAVAHLDPLLLTASDESMPDQLTVFEPNGQSYSMEFTPVLTLWQPIDLYVMAEDEAVSSLPLISEAPVATSTYVAHYVSPPTYTGLLEGLS